MVGQQDWLPRESSPAMAFALLFWRKTNALEVSGIIKGPIRNIQCTAACGPICRAKSWRTVNCRGERHREQQGRSRSESRNCSAGCKQNAFSAHNKNALQTLYRSFATHSDVLNYLHEYKEKFELDRFIVYGAKVIQLSVLLEEESGVKVSTERLPKFLLEWEQVNGVAKTSSKTFDAICIANGHYDRPSVPRLEGLDKHRGKTMHSVEYDSPECFAGETVLCIGGQASGSDLAREISQYALHVYLSVSSAKGVETRGNVTCVPRTVAVDDDGCVAFGNNCGLRTKADTIIFCTGYEYQFPFINSRSNVKLSVVSGERRVTPLYKQLWHADFPNLSFIGVPHSVVPFPLFELQVEAFVQQIIMDGDKIPAKAEREEHALRDAVGVGANKTGRVEDTHYLGSAQWDYCRDLAAMAHLYDNAMEHYISTNRVSFSFWFALYVY